ncbi:MAG: transporter substrate-binding domain-containing protein [Pseudomonadota bacterium]
MQLRGGLFILTMLWAPVMGWAQQAEPLRFSASTSWSMPYADVRDERLVGGIVFDLTQAIGAALQVPVRYVVLPRKRIEAAAQASELDVRCYFNPAWTPNPNHYIFSNPLFDASDVLVGATGQSPITELTQLPQGATVGTVLGFLYPALDRRFQDQTLLRDDALEQEKVLFKLGRGRTPYAVVNTRVLGWYKRQSGSDVISDWSLPLERTDFYCGVLKSSTHKPQKVVDAINRLKSNGQIDKILQNYQ